MTNGLVERYENIFQSVGWVLLAWERGHSEVLDQFLVKVHRLIGDLSNRTDQEALMISNLKTLVGHMKRGRADQTVSLGASVSRTRLADEVDRFEVPKSGKKKYVAIMKNGRRVGFGHRDYEHYKDQVPRSMGGGKWSKLDHGDKDRRANYRARHGGVETASGKKAYRKKFSPAWFSWHYLW